MLKIATTILKRIAEACSQMVNFKIFKHVCSYKITLAYMAQNHKDGKIALTACKITKHLLLIKVNISIESY